MRSHQVHFLLLCLFCGCLGQNVHAGSSNSLLDVSADNALVLAANADNGSVTVLETGGKVLHEIRVGEKPEGVCWIGASSTGAAACYNDDHIVFFDAKNGMVLGKLKVAPEPYGLVGDRAGKRLWVTHEYPGLVSEIDPVQRKVVREFRAGVHPRGLALSPDEKRLYVSEFYTGILRAIDLESGKVVDSWQGHSTDNLARHVELHPRRPKAYITHVRSMVKMPHGAGAIFPHVSICDLRPDKGEKRRTSLAMDTYNGVYVVTNSWESAITPDGKYLYTIYAGTDDMNISRVIDDDYREMESAGIIQLGSNPRAVRVSPDGKKLFIYNTLDFQVAIYNISGASGQLVKQTTVKVCPPAKTPEWVRGKVLFNSARGVMTARKWVSCSSCHPDGHSDGRVWQNPEGLRKTTAFFGMAHTHPLHYSADRDEVQDFEYTIRSKLMQGRGLAPLHSLRTKSNWSKVELEDKLSGQSKDLDALAIYSNSFEFVRLSPHIPAPGKLSPTAERGKVLFFSKEVGCATCHSGPYYSDSSLQKPFKLHDVGTGKDDPSEKMGPLYDTPTLLGLYRTAPYLHHGKAKTLREVLTVCNPDDRHGKTSHLKSNEVDDLVEFLRSLPYEYPPTTTPNTVTYRISPTKKE